MSDYSVDVSGRHALVIGGGSRAASEASALLAAGASVTVVAPELTASLADLVERGLLGWRRRDVLPEDLDADLVVRAGDRHPAGAPSPGRQTGTAGAPGPGRRIGTVTLVGAGPGDPGLITVAGLEALHAADVVVTDRLVPHAHLRDLPRETLVIDVAKIPGGRSTPQEEINRLLVEHARAGRSVVRLKGGDGFVFGRGGEEVAACAAAQVPTRVVPGVTSSVAGPGLAGIPVTHRGLTQGFTVVSGHVPPGHEDSTIDYAALARTGTTLVVLMGVRTLEAITTALADAGMDADTPAAVVADAGLPSQRTVRGTLKTIAGLAEDEAISPPAVAVLGAVADPEAVVGIVDT